jgi:tRNA pseudouridine38-40 synthase
MSRYFIKFQYKGTNYHGSQIQPDAISVQEVLEDKISILTREKIQLVFAGRTDAGVHASEMWAHVDFSEFIPDDNFIYRINKFLPKDIAILNVFKVTKDAHARFSAIARTYHYFITTQKNIFNPNQYLYQKKLNLDKMNEAGKALFNHKDFEAFSRTHTDVNTFICSIKKAEWKKEKDNTLVFTVKADRFLRNMVRAIVGTMLLVGEEKISIKEFNDIIKSKNRSKAGASAPAHGLFLSEVSYPQEIFLDNNHDPK